jgi:hypothetical protein
MEIEMLLDRSRWWMRSVCSISKRSVSPGDTFPSLPLSFVQPQIGASLRFACLRSGSETIFVRIDQF